MTAKFYKNVLKNDNLIAKSICRLAVNLVSIDV